MTGLNTQHAVAEISRMLERVQEALKGAAWHADRLPDGAGRNKLLKELEVFGWMAVDLLKEAQMLKDESSETASPEVPPTQASNMLDHLIKAAEGLDEARTQDAEQALEGIEAVLLGCSVGITSDAAVLAHLTKVANHLDDNYKHGAADILDKIVLAFEYKITPRSESRAPLYDAAEHNKSQMWEQTKREIAENRKQDAVLSHRPTALTLKTRYSPELPGVQVYHVADGVQQDSITHKIYDWNTGFTLNDGTKIPGGSVAEQTPALSGYTGMTRMFDTRVDLSKRRG